MLTSTGKETVIQSTLNHTLKTNPGMLPQSRALEDSSADTPGRARFASEPLAAIGPADRSGSKRANRDAGGQVVRGETGFGRRHRGSASDPESGASRVFVLDRCGDPLMPCHPARARKLLGKGRAVVVRLHPFTIRLRDRAGGEAQEVELKVDPGAKTTGLALVREDGEVLFLAEIEHRGERIRKSMRQRAGYRRRRRSANLRHRKKRFDNRRSGRKLPPSLQSRVDNVASWTERLRRLAPVTSIACEVVRFDTQALENPEIAGAEYQQGTLAGYEVRECLLEKWGRTCACCGATDTPLQVDHVRPKARGGSDRVSNLALACPSCNQAKGAQPVEAFLAGRPERLRKVLAQAKAPLSAAAAVNATRRVLFEALRRTGLPVAGSSGGRTKFNRTRLGIPKSHALDAACVGETPTLKGWRQPVLAIRAMGRGSYARTRVDRSGFPAGYLMAEKSVRGFRTGDIVRATVPSGKRRGVHVGRVAVRRTGSFNVQTAQGNGAGDLAPALPHRPARRRLRISRRHVTDEGDGNDARNTGARIPPRPEGRGFLRDCRTRASLSPPLRTSSTGCEPEVSTG